MSSKIVDLNGGLGDISNILHNQGVADLSWLCVDEEEYRKLEALPKQNLDIIPDLQKALVYSEDDIPSIIPIKPHTIVNSNPLGQNDKPGTSDIDITVPIRNRVAKLVMSGSSLKDISQKLLLEFSKGDLRIAASAIKEVLLERGLLGNVYVNSSHFPRCATDKNEQKFARTAGKRALFVLASDKCVNCVCNKDGKCSSIGNKTIVNEVPYTSSTVAHYYEQLESEKRPLSIPTGKSHISSKEWRQTLKSAFLLTPINSSPDSVKTAWTHHNTIKPNVTEEDIRNFWSRRVAARNNVIANPSPAYIKYANRMMHGNNDLYMLVGSGNKELTRLASEYGILGYTYLDMDALGGCKNTLSFIRSRNSSELSVSRNNGIGNVPDVIIRRSDVCEHCKNASDGACNELSKISIIDKNIPEANKRTFIKAVVRAIGDGRISHQIANTIIQNIKDKKDMNWTSLTAQTNLFKPSVIDNTIRTSQSNSKTHHIVKSSENHNNYIDPESIRKDISHMMNTGLDGKSLQKSILSKYAKSDLVQVPEIGRVASQYDGVQGFYFIDPTAYSDYGCGCNEGSKIFRKRGAQNILASDKCLGCKLQTHPGWCSKYSKNMLRQVSSDVINSVVEARKRLPVITNAKVENPVEKYQLSSEIKVESKSNNIIPNIRLNGNNIDR